MTEEELDSAEFETRCHTRSTTSSQRRSLGILEKPAQVQFCQRRKAAGCRGAGHPMTILAKEKEGWRFNCRILDENFGGGEARLKSTHIMKKCHSNKKMV